jgi:copper chaperone CopZ
MAGCGEKSPPYGALYPQLSYVHHISMATLNLPVHGMTCGGCARTVEKKLSAMASVAKVTVDLDGGRATIDYDAAAASPEVFAKAVRQLGFEVPA